MRDSLERRMEEFQRGCAAAGLAVTHQRQVIYEEIASCCDHPSPEAIYEKVRLRIPSISFATVYKNIHAFTGAGLLREVNLLHESVRLDANLTDHHHLVCTRCKAVVDLPGHAVTPPKLRGPNRTGFRIERYNVEVLGVCPKCASESKQPKEN